MIKARRALKTPTLTNLRKHPKAILVLVIDKDEPDKVAEYDYEWFHSDWSLDCYMSTLDRWAVDDLDIYGDHIYLLLPIRDTSLDPADWIAGDFDFHDHCEPVGGDDYPFAPFFARMHADPSILVVPEPRLYKIKQAVVV